MNYYNEYDPAAAAWLRELIKQGHIAPGDVDERSIEDVTPDELAGYTQCHFFAGIGVWSYALRQAGWPDDRPVWTGSCPCQPFSAAGKGAGFDDERHLWPSFQWLIQQCRPPVVFGEQVASKATDPWIDLVHADLEAMGYAFGCVPFPSASIGAPHIRDRAFWVANATILRRKNEIHQSRISNAQIGIGETDVSGSSSATQRMGHTISEGLEGFGSGHSTPNGHREGQVRPAAKAGESSGMADPGCQRDEFGRRSGNLGCAAGQEQGQAPKREWGGNAATDSGPDSTTGPTNGFWGAADWLLCRNGKWRPVEPGTFPLAHGTPARVGRLRGYGNAINAQAAKEFIKAFYD